MKKTLIFFLVVCIAVLSTGCPRGRAKMPAVVSDKLIKYEVDYFQKNLDDYNRMVENNQLERAKLIRNETIFRLKRNIDANYADFENNLFIGKAGSNVLFDITELGAAAAVGITNGERAKSIIGTALTAFKGGRKSLDVNFFREKTTESLISTMRAARFRVYNKINIGLQNDVADYTLEEALGDLIDYFFAGSLANALVELSQQAAENAKVERAVTTQGEKERLKAGLKESEDIDSIRTRLYTAINTGTDAEKAAARRTLIKALTILKSELPNFEVSFDEKTASNQNLFDELQRILRKAALMENPPTAIILKSLKSN